MRWCITLHCILSLAIMIQSTPLLGEQCSMRITTRIPHLTDCSRYYECLYGKWRLQQCKSALLFDVGTLQCVYSTQARCAVQKMKKSTYVDSHNIKWSLQPAAGSAASRHSQAKSRVRWTVRLVNSVPTHTVFTVYNSDEPSYVFTKPGDLPKVTDVIQWVKDHADQYDKTYIEYKEDDVPGVSLYPATPRVNPLTSRPITTTSRPAPTTTRRPAASRPDTDVLPTNCGRSYRRYIQFKISQGRNTHIARIPWQVGLLHARDRDHLCGGSIVTSHHVISAAHCFFDGSTNTWKTASDIVVRVGDYDKNLKEVHEADIQVYKVHRHQQYNMKQRAHDIALLTMKWGIDFTPHVLPICIPQDSAGTRYTPGRKCVISGWGDTNHGATYTSRLLQATDIPLVQQQECQHIYPKKVTNGMMCAGDLVNGGVDTCQGDSGGPLACQDGGRYFLYGITSWGAGCGEVGWPGVYTRVAEYRGWIISNVEKTTSQLLGRR